MADFNDVIGTLNGIPQAINTATEQGLADAAMLVVAAAKQKLGIYQPASGEYSAWPVLKPESVHQKYRSRSKRYKISRAGRRYLQQHGQWGNGGNDDAPLINKSHLRQAITADLSNVANGVAYVGIASGENTRGASPGVYAAAHEFGLAASNIPPRPFLRPAVIENKEAIQESITAALRNEVLNRWR